jgi:hypothetical protein
MAIAGHRIVPIAEEHFDGFRDCIDEHLMALLFK